MKSKFNLSVIKKIVKLSNRLLIWFSVVSVFIATVSVWISRSYFNTKDEALRLTTDVHSTYFNFLKLKNLTNEFFAFETKNTMFYESKKSAYLTEIEKQNGILKKELSELKNKYSESFQVFSFLNEIETGLDIRDSVFQHLARCVLIRGFKDYGKVGYMREHAHVLERKKNVDKALLLSLRRREKDYLLRHEYQYIEKFSNIVAELKKDIKRYKNITEVELALSHLDEYAKSFNKVIYYDELMGLHNNGGLKGELSKDDKELEHLIQNTISVANVKKEKELAELQKSLFIMVAFAIIFCFLLANILSSQVTKPISRLTSVIEGIILNDFKTIPLLYKKHTSRETQILYREFGQMIDLLNDHQEERDRLISKLSLSEKKFKEMAYKLPQGMFETDKNGVFLYVNKMWEENFGYSKCDAEYTLNVFDITKPVQSKQENRKQNEVIAHRKDGTWFPALLYKDKVYYNGEFVGWRGVIVDISERYEYLSLLRKEQRKAKESDRLKTAFLANISHEVRTPLNAIMGFSSLLRNDVKNENKQNFCNIIESSSQDLLTIFDDMILISRMESDEFSLNEVDVSLADLQSKLESIAKRKIEAQHKSDLKVDFKLLDECKKASVNFDEEKVVCILERLIDNAIKFSEEGSVELSCKVLKSRIVFSVKDNGIGVHPDKHKVIFEPFRQVNETHSRTHGGIGLGLSICKGLVNQLNGNIWLESEEGIGTAFFVSIPYNLSNANNQINYKIHQPLESLVV